MSTTVKYKTKLKQVMESRSKAASSVYVRAKLLNEVFDDREFRADIGHTDDLRAAEALDKYCDDIAFRFLDLRAMLAAVPDEKQWGRLSLRDIYEQAMAKPKQEHEENGRRSPRRVTVKQYDDLETRFKGSEARAKYLEEVSNERAKTVDELLAENKELRRQLAHAEGRIAELEKVLNRDLVAA